MTLDEFTRVVPGFLDMGHSERIKHLGWFILTQRSRDRFSALDVSQCYDGLHIQMPANIHALLQKMCEKRSPELLKDVMGYRLEAKTRLQLDGRYGTRPVTIAVHEMLKSLPGRISDEAERLFLSEALVCFSNKAFRAAIVMTWNLAYDHLLNWVLAKHLVAFNSAIGVRYPKRSGVTIGTKDDFENFKESEVIEICGSAGIINGNIKKILNEKLSRRNMAAHPSRIEVTQIQAEDVITDLVNNVVLLLSV